MNNFNTGYNTTNFHQRLKWNNEWKPTWRRGSAGVSVVVRLMKWTVHDQYTIYAIYFAGIKFHDFCVLEKFAKFLFANIWLIWYYSVYGIVIVKFLSTNTLSQPNREILHPRNIYMAYTVVLLPPFLSDYIPLQQDCLDCLDCLPHNQILWHNVVMKMQWVRN